MKREFIDPIAYAWAALHRTPFPLGEYDSRAAKVAAFHWARRK